MNKFILGLLVGAIAGLILKGNTAIAQQTYQKWDFMWYVPDREENRATTLNIINSYGNQGWDLIEVGNEYDNGVLKRVFYLKRAHK